MTRNVLSTTISALGLLVVLSAVRREPAAPDTDQRCLKGCKRERNKAAR